MLGATHYDVIIMGSGAGGGTLALKLAGSGKNILILERGDYLSREKENWDSDGGFCHQSVCCERQVARQARQGIPARYTLRGRRGHQDVWSGAFSPAQRGIQ